MATQNVELNTQATAYPGVVTVQPNQVVVVQQQQQGVWQKTENERYKVGLMDFCHTPGFCIMASLGCYCCVVCLVARRLNENACYPCFFGVIPLSVRFRSIVGIKESMCSEGCSFYCCPCCFGLRLLNEMEERQYQMARS